MSPITLYPGTALVTGALTDVGRAVALAFAAEGCPSIFLIDTSDDELALAALAKQITQTSSATNCGYAALRVAGDDSFHSAVAKSVQGLGRIDYAVNVLDETLPPKTILETEPSDFDIYLEKTMNPTFFFQQAQIRQMQEQKPIATVKSRPATHSIVNVSSVLGLATSTKSSAVAAGQHGVVGFTRSGAVDCAHLGIRINSVCPGAMENLVVRDAQTAELELAKSPAGRLCRVDEVVDAVLFLSSGRASGINGHCLPVDGAWMLRHV